MTGSQLPTLALRQAEHMLLHVLNDMRTVVEARCHLHGSGGGTTANSAAALLPLIAIEMVAERTAAPAENKEARLRRSFHDLATLTGYTPYGRLGHAMFVLCRNGLAHSFYPGDVQPPNGPAGVFCITFWIDETTRRSVCVDEVGDRSASRHLVPENVGSQRLILVSAQHLCRDATFFVEDFLRRIREDSGLQILVEANELRVASDARQIAATSLSEGDKIHLGL